MLQEARGRSWEEVQSLLGQWSRDGQVGAGGGRWGGGGCGGCWEGWGDGGGRGGEEEGRGGGGWHAAPEQPGLRWRSRISLMQDSSELTEVTATQTLGQAPILRPFRPGAVGIGSVS